MTDFDLLNHYADLPGFAAKEKVQFMYELARRVQPSLAVEVGVYGGRTLFPLKLGAPNAFVVGIDAWDGNVCTEGEPDNYTEIWRAHDFEGIYRGVLDECARTAFPPTLIRANHLDSVRQFSDQTIDILHEDGNHSPTICRRSMDVWIPKLRVGGILVWDDPGWADNEELVRSVHNDRGLKLLERRQGYDVLGKVAHL